MLFVMDLEPLQRLLGMRDVLTTLGVCYGAKSIFDELETSEFCIGQTKIKRVAIIHFIMNKSDVPIVDAVSKSR